VATKILGKSETVRKMIKMLVEMIPEHRQEINDAYHKKNYTELADIAHKLIGSSCYCGTLRLKDVSKNLEMAALAKNAKKIKMLISKVYDEMDSVIKAYNKI